MSKPIEIEGEKIRIDMKWWVTQNDFRLGEDDLLYLSSIIVGQSICPRVSWIQNTEKARRILRLEKKEQKSSADSGS